MTYPAFKQAMAADIFADDMSRGSQIYLLNEAGAASGPVFVEGDHSGGWAPGYSMKKSFYINNPTDQEFYIKTIKINLGLKDIDEEKTYNRDDDVYKDFVKYIGAKIEDAKGGDLYSSSLERLSEGIAPDNVCTINPGENRKFYFTMWMDKDAGDSLQGLKCSFDISFICSTPEEHKDYSGHKKSGGRVKVVSDDTHETPSTNPVPEEPEPTSPPTVIVPPDDTQNGEPLPKTGAMLDMETLIFAGVLITGIGTILVFEKTNN